MNEGDADWPAIVAELDRIGYRGWFAAEMRGGDEAHLADIAAREELVGATGLTAFVETGGRTATTNWRSSMITKASM